MKILHVDDDQTDHELISYYLKSESDDIELSWIDSAEKAIEHVNKERPDCIISDYQMPGMDGLEFLRVLRSQNDETPFIFYTGQGNEQIAAEALRIGADDYYTKQMGFAHFDRLINSIKRVVVSHAEIVKRKNIEKSLYEAEEKYRSLFEQAGDYIILLNPEGLIITDVNESCCARHGYSRDELIGRSVLNIDMDSFSEDEHKRRMQALMSGESIIFETSHRCKDGTLFPVEVSAKVADVGGKKSIISIERDITEKKQAEKASKQYEQEREILLGVSQNVNMTLDLQTVLQIMSDGAAELFDIETSAIYLLNGDELFLWATTPRLDPNTPEDLRRACIFDHPHIEKAITKQQPIILADTNSAELSKAERAVVEIRGLRSLLYLPFKQGEDVAGVLILGSVGRRHEFSRYEIDLCQTIGNQLATGVQNALLHEELKRYSKELESEIMQRKQTEEALRRSETHLSNALQIGKLGHWEFDLAENLFYFTDELFELLGTDVEKMGGYTMSPERYAEMFMHPEDQHLLEEEIRKVKESTDPDHSNQVEHRIIYADGKTGYIAVRYKAVADGGGKIVKTIGINQDITERKLSGVGAQKLHL